MRSMYNYSNFLVRTWGGQGGACPMLVGFRNVNKLEGLKV